MVSTINRVISLAVLLVPVAAFANSSGQTNWSLLPTGGTYSWDGNANDGLVGSGIGVGTVGGVGTSSNNGSTLPIFFGSLDFTSGAYNGNGSNWSWGAGGELNVTGCIASVTSAICTGSNNVTLISDDFQSVSIKPVLQLGLFSFDVVFGSLSGDINSQVASYFGMPTAFSASSMNIIFTTSTPGKALYGANLGGNIQANSTVAVSEDWGLGSTLAFFAFFAAVFGLAWRLGLVKPVVL
jgi:hypothetical protein